jgi:hypothetical protein
MYFADSNFESQRDSGLQPRVARNELPWVAVVEDFNPNGVVSPFLRQAATPLGLCARARVPQGSSFLATLGYETQSLWDCRYRRTIARWRVLSSSSHFQKSIGVTTQFVRCVRVRRRLAKRVEGGVNAALRMTLNWMVSDGVEFPDS